MNQKESRPAKDGAATKNYAVLEYAALRLARGEPLFYEIPEMKEYNEQYRKELVSALAWVLRVLERNDPTAVKTAVSETVLRTYTSG